MNLPINYKGVWFDVEFDYQPEEKEVRYYSDGSGYPGCAENVEQINEIRHKGTCFYELLEDQFEEIEEVILEAIHEE